MGLYQLINVPNEVQRDLARIKCQSPISSPVVGTKTTQPRVARVRFSQSVQVAETYSATEYDRTCTILVDISKLSPAELECLRNDILSCRQRQHFRMASPTEVVFYTLVAAGTVLWLNYFAV